MVTNIPTNPAKMHAFLVVGALGQQRVDLRAPRLALVSEPHGPFVQAESTGANNSLESAAAGRKLAQYVDAYAR